jgi:hypothetical protein
MILWRLPDLVCQKMMLRATGSSCLKYIHTNISLYVGTGTRYIDTYTHFAWAGETFFTVVLLCQFLVLAGNRFWFYILMYLEYNTVVVLVVLVFGLAGNSFLCYVNT